MVEFGSLPIRLPRWSSTSLVYLIAGLLLAAISAIIIDPCDAMKTRLASRVSSAGEHA
jgi:hypothetical protein